LTVDAVTAIAIPDLIALAGAVVLAAAGWLRVPKLLVVKQSCATVYRRRG